MIPLQVRGATTTEMRLQGKDASDALGGRTVPLGELNRGRLNTQFFQIPRERVQPLEDPGRAPLRRKSRFRAPARHHKQEASRNAAGHHLTS